MADSEGEQKGYIARVFWVIIVIAALLFLAVVIINYSQAGVIGSIFNNFYANIQQTGIVSALSGVYTDVSNAVTNPASLQKGYSFESEIEKEQTDPDLGVKIKKLEQFGYANFGQPIRMMGTIRAKMPEDSKLDVYCQLGDEQPVNAFVSSPDAINNEVSLRKGQLAVFDAQCEFPKGLSPEKATYVSLKDIKETLPIEVSKTAKMYVLFTYKTNAKLRVYLMNSDELRALQAAEKDPFKYFGLDNDPHLNYDNTLDSVTTAGPVKLGIGTPVSQPLTENVPYSLGVTVSSNSDWIGQLKKIESLNILTDDIFRLENDADYGERHFASGCQFDPTGQKDQYGFSIYTLKDSELAWANQECDKQSLKAMPLTEQKCIDLFGKNKDMTFRCNMKAPEVPHSGMKYYIVGSEARYLYQTERITSVDAFNAFPGANIPSKNK